jgi:hypothetical protein
VFIPRIAVSILFVAAIVTFRSIDAHTKFGRLKFLDIVGQFSSTRKLHTFWWKLWNKWYVRFFFELFLNQFLRIRLTEKRGDVRCGRCRTLQGTHESRRNSAVAKMSRGISGRLRVTTTTVAMKHAEDSEIVLK